ncbi:MAG: alkyl hydroperoxide reductase [Bacillota bacterium]|nr:alkyl hydroperoxide reductase [Bacillota bacterium]
MRRLEERFGPRGLVVLGIHSGKFTAERETEAIRAAAQRLGIRHPVANDAAFSVWESYAVRAWPTLIFVDPAGRLIGRHEGEFAPAEMERVVAGLLDRFRAEGLLRPGGGSDPPAGEPPAGPRGLAFPGKVRIAGDRVWISDSGHGRVLVFDRAGRLLERIEGMLSPQGMAWVDGTLWVADPPAGRIWRVPGGRGRPEAWAGDLRQPWDLASDGRYLWIAMAGAHQLWRAGPGEEPRPWAGTGWEGLRDGQRQMASFAQPSALACASGRLWVADSEASAVREVDLAAGSVRTLVGTGLFDFGDRDGAGEEVRLQHPLDLAWDRRRRRLYIADTYNGKVKRLDPGGRRVVTLAGGFHEPGGLAWDPGSDRIFVCDTNDHAIRLLHPEETEIRRWSPDLP